MHCSCYLCYSKFGITHVLNRDEGHDLVELRSFLDGAAEQLAAWEENAEQKVVIASVVKPRAQSRGLKHANRTNFEYFDQ